MKENYTSSGLLRDFIHEKYLRYKKIFEPKTKNVEKTEKLIKKNETTESNFFAKDKSLNFFAVLLLPEWLNLVSWTEVRLNNRVSAINSENLDQMEFNELISKAPQINSNDESGYVVAELIGSDFDTKSKDFKLKIEDVCNFFGMSEHANRLLEPESVRANCKLSTPIFENLWSNYKVELERKNSDRRGRIFLRSLGLNDLQSINLEKKFVSDWYQGIKSPLTVEQSSKLQSLSGRTSYGFMCALIALSKATRSVEKIRHELNDAKKTFNEEKKYSVIEPILYNCNDKLLATIKKLSYIEEDCRINFASAAMIFNYRDILDGGKIPELKNLFLDLAMLKFITNEDQIVSETAFYIGRSLPDSLNSSILYESLNTNNSMLKKNIEFDLSFDESFNKVLNKYRNEKPRDENTNNGSDSLNKSSNHSGQTSFFD